MTFQATNVDESRYMYDQLAVLAPIMLAMTAASPIFKGRLADIDARWTVIAQCVDDRTPAERGLLSPEEAAAVADPRMAGSGIRRIPKSRYDSISTYIYHCKGDSACQRTFEIYNDISCPVDEEVKARLRSAGLDENLAQHVAHLFTRDPIVAYAGKIEQNDEESTDHFESIQSTNWQTCRWKPPPPHLHAEDPHIGWRTEFRSEVEAAAATSSPQKATAEDGASSTSPADKINCGCKGNSNGPSLSPEDSCEEMTMGQIFNGKGEYFPGLLPLVYSYLDFIQCDSETYRRVDQYLQFIEKRAKGELLTPATWMRRFVQGHPSYKGDSVVSPEIAHDLMRACKEFGEGSLHIPELLGDIKIDR